MTTAEFQALRKKANIAQHGLGYTCWEGQLELFAKLVRNAALEEAAQKCNGRLGGALQSAVWWSGFKSAKNQCVTAIESLKEPTP